MKRLKYSHFTLQHHASETRSDHTFVVYSPSMRSFSISRERPKSATLHTSVSLTKILRAAKP